MSPLTQAQEARRRERGEGRSPGGCGMSALRYSPVVVPGAAVQRDAPMRAVACGGCPSHCCKNDAIILHPELGDDVSSYEAEAIRHPLTGQPAMMLKHKPNGDCIYLGAAGCEIHGRHPAICRKYDCGDQYAKMGRENRRALIARGLFSRAQLAQGRKVHLARETAVLGKPA
ncbi:YkgJ family cysteine cluster protein [Phenylobacterium sp.]|uniref:YkgJ family cysteine cluster protein n=1 Tax=Phenylobacterium sp. TaxID=1871053 RepID=UPI0027245976|nr:YkgJ family cysteine cluster protein [Phenylobacterium sp.]MDO8800078.1 YkgJ family cysteine cluster protein [Phenylobacterium sp.]